MKTRLTLLTVLLILAITSSAYAIYMPPAGPLFIKFNNVEQISPTQSIEAPSGVFEINWGVLEVTSVFSGNITNETQNFPATGEPVWTDTEVGEITGIFGGLQLSPDYTTGETRLLATGGSIYLYYDSVDNADLSLATPGQRTGDFAFTNFTDGEFLAKIDFMNGAWDAALPNTSIVGSTAETSAYFLGFANSFGSVDIAAGGAWAELLDTNYFNTELGDNTADFKFRNVYERYESGHTWDDLANGIVGADSTDPARAYVPEPASMSLLLLGAGLLGLVGYRRRRK